MGTPVSLSKLNGRFRSFSPAAMFTARLQAAMMRLATMTTSVMSWIIVRRRPVDGSNASTATGVPWKGNARSRVVRARSSEPVDPSVATMTASTGRRAALATDRLADGQTVDDSVRVVPKEVRKEVSDVRHRRSRRARADRGRPRQLVARDDPERVPQLSLGWALVDQRHTAHSGRRAELGQHVAWDGRNVGGSGTVRRREAAERVGEGVFPRAACAGAAGGGGDRAERPDRGAGNEEGDREPTDEPKAALGLSASGRR